MKDNKIISSKNILTLVLKDEAGTNNELEINISEEKSISIMIHDDGNKILYFGAYKNTAKKIANFLMKNTL